jgi:hypothetical protein
MAEKDPITLATLYGGAVVEAVDHELQNALANIVDPNTSLTKARTVTLTITLKPNKERNLTTLSFVAKSALAPAEALESSVLIERDKSGKPVGFELSNNNPYNQGVLPIFAEGK